MLSSLEKADHLITGMYEIHLALFSHYLKLAYKAVTKFLLIIVY